MHGPYPLPEVSLRVAPNSIGAYILSRDGRTARYVGRSDSDLSNRIIASKNDGHDYRSFWFDYTSSARDAYLLECDLYHRYDPPDNTNHPAVPQGTYWRCPVKTCSWS